MIVFAVYQADAWLSYASRDLLGIYSTRRKAMKRIKNKTKLTDDDLWNLDNYNQTQCRENENDNYIIEEIKVNEDL